MLKRRVIVAHMIIAYDKEADALYIWLIEGEHPDNPDIELKGVLPVIWR